MTGHRYTLSKRLSVLIEMCPRCGCAADIGCDHGYVSIELVSRGIADRAIAADLREGPLSRARENIAAAGLDGSVETRLSDGLSGFFPNEADVIIIAGMGGRLIEDIIERGITVASAADAVLLGAQSEQYELRRFLYEAGFVIADEDMVAEDGKFYPLIRAEYVADADRTAEMLIPPTAAELRYGARLIEKRHPVLREYLVHRRQELLRTRRQIEAAGSGAMERNGARIADIDRELTEIEEIGL